MNTTANCWDFFFLIMQETMYSSADFCETVVFYHENFTFLNPAPLKYLSVL